MEWRSRTAASIAFRLARTTRSDRLLIPEKLYGREREIADAARVF